LGLYISSYAAQADLTPSHLIVPHKRGFTIPISNYKTLQQYLSLTSINP
jgi:hypothetical protein